MKYIHICIYISCIPCSVNKSWFQTIDTIFWIEQESWYLFSSYSVWWSRDCFSIRMCFSAWFSLLCVFLQDQEKTSVGCNRSETFTWSRWFILTQSILNCVVQSFLVHLSVTYFSLLSVYKITFNQVFMQRQWVNPMVIL